MKKKLIFPLLFSLSLFSASLFYAGEGMEIPLPLPAIQIEQTRSDPGRPARAHGQYYTGPIFDTHTHLYPPKERDASPSDINEGEVEDILDLAKKMGVERIIFMPTPNDGNRRNQELGVTKRLMARDLDRERVRVLCGSNYITNWMHDAYASGYSEDAVEDILKQLSEDIDSGDFAGVGELGIYHFDKGFGGQNIIEFPPNFSPMVKVVDLIAQKGMWLDLHAEPVDPGGKSYEKELFGGFELYYQRNPGLKLIFSHTGMTNPVNARRLLKKYPNMMMNIKAVKKHQWWRNLEPVVSTSGELYEDWARLFEEMPERFMIGTDMHFGRREVSIYKYEKKIATMRAILGTLNPKAARLIASENAKRNFP